MSDESLQIMIDHVGDYICKQYSNLTNNTKISLESIKIHHFYSIKSTDSYDLDLPNKQYNINSFNEIGWPEPFGND